MYSGSQNKLEGKEAFIQGAQLALIQVERKNSKQVKVLMMGFMCINGSFD